MNPLKQWSYPYINLNKSDTENKSKQNFPSHELVTNTDNRLMLIPSPRSKLAWKHPLRTSQSTTIQEEEHLTNSFHQECAGLTMSLLARYTLAVHCGHQESQEIQVAQRLWAPGVDAGWGELETLKQGEGVVGLWLPQVFWYLLETQPNQVTQTGTAHDPHHCVCVQ